MSELTCGERAVKCLLGEPIDRVPYGSGLGWVPWPQTLEKWRIESGRPDLDCAEHFGFDLSFAVPNTIPGIFPVFETVVIEEDENYIIVRNEHGITMRCLKCGQSMPEFLDYPVKTPADWEQLKEERLCIDNPSRISQDWDVFRKHIHETGEAVQMGNFPYGVFGTVRDLLGAEEMLVSFCTEPEMIQDMMDHLTSLWISIWEKVAEQVQIDHIHIWEDMCGKNGSLISPTMIKKFMMPCYDRIADFAKRANVRIVSVDSDGDCSELVEIVTEHGINMFLPFEVQAGCDILEYRKKYPNLGISGGLDKRALAGTKSDVDVEIKKCAQMIEIGRFIPGFDHLVPPDASWENFDYAAREIKKICYGIS